jgi:tetratricopeptide (TPR) repeat protein
MSRLEELEKMLDASPDDPFLIYALAREYEQLQSTMQALLMYEHLVTNYPTYVATYFHYAKLLYAAGNRIEARKLLETGIGVASKEGDHHAAGEMKGLLTLWFDTSEEED